MDSKSKKININNNMLVGLKAELLRKQEHQRKPIPEITTSRFRTKNHNEEMTVKRDKKTSKTIVKNNEPTAEEIKQLESVRKNMERKVKLYEQIQEQVLTMDNSSKLPFLVDFEQKAIDDVRTKRAQSENERYKRKRTSSDDDDDDHNGGDDDDEWVDYVDSLGRSRKCLKKDLPRFKELDNKNFAPSIHQKQEKINPDEPHLLSRDMKREMERQKWEEAMKELSAKEDIHYSDVTFKEIRDHGVGFFQFSKDEHMRSKQMDLLKQLREQTKAQRKIYSSLKEKKRKMLEIRLAKIMQRKVVQEAIRVSGLDPHTLIAGIKEDDWSEEVKDEDEEGGLIGSEDVTNHESDDEGQEISTRDDSWRRDAPVREWDVGKKTFNEDVWLDKRREERPSDFAPIYTNLSTDPDRYATQECNSMEDVISLNLRKLRNLIS